MTVELATTENVDKTKVLQSLGINVNDPRSQAVILVCNRYQLAPELKHVMVIANAPYITKAGYMHIAHRSGVFDGIEILEEKETDKQCSARVAVYRKDMGRPFVTSARFNKSEAKGRDPMDMALARATRRGLQQAFDVADVFGNADEVTEEDLAFGPRGVSNFSAGGSPEVDGVSSVRETATETSAPAETIEAAAVEDDEPFPEPDDMTPSALVTKLTQSFPGAEVVVDDETGEIADAGTRQRLLALIDELDEEQRQSFLRDWTNAKLGALKDSAKKPKLLVSQVPQAEKLIEAQIAKQSETYDRRRKHINARLKELGVTTDDGRHEFIKEATQGETDTSKALLGRQVSAINDYADHYAAADEEPAEEPESLDL